MSKRDNSTLKRKYSLRINALTELGKSPPIVLEAFGGYGRLFAMCYSNVETGMVIDKKREKAEFLAKQRPTWMVFEGDSEKIISSGVGGNLRYNFLDLDPYGQPWPIIDALFNGRRKLADKLVIVVHDGLRLKLKCGGAWTTSSLEEVVAKKGNDWVYKNYLEVAHSLLVQAGDKLEYDLTRWTGYYTGSGKAMTHYAAVFERPR